jgi:hypothetical protein
LRIDAPVKSQSVNRRPIRARVRLADLKLHLAKNRSNVLPDAEIPSKRLSLTSV